MCKICRGRCTSFPPQNSHNGLRSCSQEDKPWLTTPMALDLHPKDIFNVPRRRLSAAQRARRDAVERAASDEAQTKLAADGGILSFTAVVSHERLMASERKSTKRTRTIAGASASARVEPASSTADTGSTDASESESKSKKPATLARGAPKTSYSDRQKEIALEVFAKHAEQMDETAAAKAAAEELVAKNGWNAATTDARMIRRFKQAKEEKGTKNKPGRPVNAAFEEAVKDELMVSHMDGTTTSAAFSYEIVKQVAQEVAARVDFIGDPLLKDMKFSTRWFGNWKRRVGVSKRKTTGEAKPDVDMDEATAKMEKISQDLQAMGYTRDQIANADETADEYAAFQEFVLLPKGEQRALAPHPDSSARVTAHLGVCADGSSLPPFVILKNYSRKDDMSSSTVAFSVAELAAELDSKGPPSRAAAAQASDEPTTDIWEKTLSFVDRRTKETHERKFKIPYAKMPDGTIVTANHKAWMNTAFAVMWIDLVMAPLCASRGGKMALIWDNCGPHCTHAVRNALEEAGIGVFMLPPNTTDKFQVCDLVVNKLFKSQLRRLRAHALLDSFRLWRADFLRAKAAKQHVAIFSESDRADPAKASLIKHLEEQAKSAVAWKPKCPKAPEGLQTLMAACRALDQEQYRRSIARAFVRLGLAPREEGDWVKLSAATAASLTASDSSSAEDRESVRAVDMLGVPGLLALKWDSTDSEPYDDTAAPPAHAAVAAELVAGAAAGTLA